MIDLSCNSFEMVSLEVGVAWGLRPQDCEYLKLEGCSGPFYRCSDSRCTKENPLKPRFLPARGGANLRQLCDKTLDQQASKTSEV